MPSTWSTLVCLLTLLGNLLAWSPAAAAADLILMQVGNIRGDVTLPEYRDWIRVRSASYGARRTISTPGSGGTRGGSAPSLDPVRVIKAIDRSSAGLFRESVVGTAISEVRLVFLRSPGAAPDGSPLPIAPHLELLLSNVLISQFTQSFQVGADGSVVPVEALDMDFEQIQVTVTRYDEAGDVAETLRSGYDRATGQET